MYVVTNPMKTFRRDGSYDYFKLFFYKCRYHYWNIDIFSAVQNVSTECNELINLWVSSVKIPMPHLHENVLTLINLQYSSYMQLNYIILQSFKYIAIRFAFIPYEHLLRRKECYDTYFINFYKTMWISHTWSLCCHRWSSLYP